MSVAARTPWSFVAGALVLAAVSCRPADAPDSSQSAEPGTSGGDVQQEVVYERLPDGTVKKTTITRRTVPAPAPAARAADAYPTEPLVRYNVERVNAYRAQGGLAPLLYDARLSAFALAGSQRLARDHVPHANFAENAQAQRFGSRSAENQGDPRGVPALDADPARNGTRQVDVMLKLMMDEGPGGGHYDTIMSPKLRRVGVGIAYVGGRFYMTNDFSD
jgi:uncharacterized protein YkwD